MSGRRVLVTGAGGFIGHHLVTYLKEAGDWVRGVDLVAPEFAPSAADEFLRADLREPGAALAAMEGVEEVYALAADMGGMGFISRDEATILLALCDEPERIVPNWRIVDNVWNAFIRVDDVERIYAEVQERGAGIDYTIYNAPSGFRE